MKSTSAAKRYATALVSVAQEKGKLEAIGKELELIAATVAGHLDLKVAMESPTVKPSQKKALYAQLVEKLSIGIEVKNLISILIDQDRMGELSLIGMWYRDLADEQLGQVRVSVKSAVKLGAEQDKLKAVLEKNLGQKVLLDSIVDPQILGGISVQVKDKVFDASLRRDLERMKEMIGERVVF